MDWKELLFTKNVKQVQYFFYSQAFADGLRATLAILLPALIGAYTNYFEEGLTISLGAMCTSLTDAPGPVLNKRNGMLFCSAFTFLIALLTGFAQANVLTMGIEILFVTFFFSMFVVYGARATGVGNAAVLIMILTMDRPFTPAGVLPHALLILGGGLFYTVLSLTLHRIRPYRTAQRVLGECTREIANYLAIRADFYNIHTNLDTDYKRLVAQQIVVNEKQDLVREVFFKTRQIVEESTNESRRLIFAFVSTIDLFEDVTASYYDYRLLRELYGDTGALDVVHRSLRKIVDEVHAVALSIQGNTRFTRTFNYDEEVRTLKARIDATHLPEEAQKMVLKKIVVNIRNLLSDLDKIEQYFSPATPLKSTGVDHSHFVTHQPLDPKLFWTNVNMQSAAFRHAIRVSSACIVGYLLTTILPYGTHSYWILLTIAFIIKPAFSLTKQRNIQRIIGTLVGGAFGVAILLLVDNKTALFFLMVLFMLGTYSFMRINYLAMVFCITPYILILFGFLGAQYRQVAGERILDTVIGCVIAFIASYLLFPNWEADQLKNYMKSMLKANAIYLHKILQALSGQPVSMLEYKLARKEVYLHSANLSAAFQRMLSEPKSKQSSQSQVQQFVVLNHILFSNVATIATTLITHDAKPYRAELVQLAKNTFCKLADSVKKFDPAETLSFPQETVDSLGNASGDDELIREQLQFIYTVSKDIDRISATLLEQPKQGQLVALQA